MCHSMFDSNLCHIPRWPVIVLRGWDPRQGREPCPPQGKGTRLTCPEMTGSSTIAMCAIVCSFDITWRQGKLLAYFRLEILV